MKKNAVMMILRDILLSLAAAFVAAVNLNMFVHIGNLVPGGFSGLSVLLVRVFGDFYNIRLNYSVLYLLFNIPGLLLVFRHVGKKFTLISLIDVVFTSLLVQVLPYFEVTEDMLLISVFGGIMGGISALLVLTAGGSGGGTDFIAIYFSKIRQKSMWNTILGFNVILLLTSGILFGWDIALYSIIYQFVQTQVLDLYDKRYKRSCFIIITDKPQEIAEAVFKEFNHSVTEFEGIGSYTHHSRNVLYTVVGKYEEQQLINIIARIDPKAFVNIMDSERVVGNFVQKPF